MFPTHNKGHTLDLVFSPGLDFFNFPIEDILVREHYCIFLNLIFSPDLLPLKRPMANQDTIDRFSALFDPCSAVRSNDAEAFLPVLIITAWDKVALIKYSLTCQKVRPLNE